jgi:hypothetical protein
MIEVFSSGGGTQSTCMAALIVQGRLPKPDYVVIADTGRECETTWQYMDAVTIPALNQIGVEVHRILPDWQSVPAHGMNYMTHNGNTMIIPAWTDQNGDVGKLSGFCSSRWKVEVVDRFLSRQFGITRSKYRKWIGFSLDEWRRAQRLMTSEEGRKGLIRLPLVYDVPLKRYEAIKEVVKMGWPTPPRSRCWMCPNQQDDEWSEMPLDEFDKAVAFEKEIQVIDPHAWLHKSCLPLDTCAPFPQEATLFDSGIYCTSGVCFI